MDGRKKKSPESIHIKRAMNGGYVVRHSYNNYGSGESYMPDQEHAFTSHAEMLKHVTKHTTGAKDGDADDAGATAGTGRPPTHAVPAGAAHVTGVAGRAKAAPPTARTKGAGVD